MHTKDCFNDSIYFNPRSREGSDAFVINVFLFTLISIHAPAKGATCSMHTKDRFNNNFNPRSREGSDQTIQKKLKKICKFQSTLPRRERLIDHMAYQIARFISIHAPAKGATVFATLPSFLTPISIHAPAKGATGTKKLKATSPKDFNPRSREGSDTGA